MCLTNTASRHQDQKSHHHVRKYFLMVCSESPRMHHRHMCALPHSLHRQTESVCERETHVCVCVRRTLCTGSICPFFSCPPICVCSILHIFMYAHTRMKTLNTHKGTVSLYAYKHTDQKKRTQTQEREKKRDVEDVFGGRSLGIGSGWWSRQHLQVLEACLPRSLHTCLETERICLGGGLWE